MAGGGHADGPAGQQGCPRWLVLALLLSVGLNLAVAGIYAGQFMREESEERRRGFEARVEAALPPERAALVAEIFGRIEGDPEARAERYMAATRAMDAAMRAEPFESAALEAALDERMGFVRDHFDRRSQQIVRLAEALSHEERAAIGAMMVEQAERRLARWEKRRTR